MNYDQSILFGLLAVVFVLLIWGRWRYDLVAFGALMAAAAAGVIAPDKVFAGFGHPATVIIALVLIVSRGLSNSGAVELLARFLVDRSRRLSTHIVFMSGISAALSAVMNNVAALALLMPVDLQAAAKAKRSPALTLMPLSFASILGGMITLIGTPPNIVIAQFRGTALGQPYAMFDFAPVGLVCAVVGVAFIATVGWRLIPTQGQDHKTAGDAFRLDDYIAEVRVPEQATIVGKKIRELDDVAEENDGVVLGLVRRGRRLAGQARAMEIKPNDILVIEASPANIERLVGELKLEYIRKQDSKESPVTAEEMSLVEVVVPQGARIEGRSALSLRLLYRHGITLLGVSRQGKRFRDRVRKLDIAAGDVLLLLGPSEQMSQTVTWLGCLPLAERGLQLIQRKMAGLTVGAFILAVALAATGVVYLPAALGLAAMAMVLTKVVPIRQLYDSVEWPVIVLLGCMIPIGSALEASGGTALIADAITGIAEGYSPVVVLVLLILVTMSLSDVMNNTATAVIAAPIAVDIAHRLDVNPDPFLMGVAVAASCAFLTPIGHKNNTLILGPGGYHFGDYWRMGLPLEILIVIVSTPMILWVWPL